MIATRDVNSSCYLLIDSIYPLFFLGCLDSILMLARCHHFEVPPHISVFKCWSSGAPRTRANAANGWCTHFWRGWNCAAFLCYCDNFDNIIYPIYICILYILSIVAINYIGAIILGPAFCDGRFAFVFSKWTNLVFEVQWKAPILGTPENSWLAEAVSNAIAMCIILNVVHHGTPYLISQIWIIRNGLKYYPQLAGLLGLPWFTMHHHLSPGHAEKQQLTERWSSRDKWWSTGLFFQSP